MQQRRVYLIVQARHIRVVPAPIEPSTEPSPKVSLPVLDDLPERAPRPKTRKECLPGGSNEARPCVYLSCRFHLLLNIDSDGTVHQMAETIHDLPATCVLDVAAETDETNRTQVLSALEPYFGMTRENLRHLEQRALEKMEAGMANGSSERTSTK